MVGSICGVAEPNNDRARRRGGSGAGRGAGLRSCGRRTARACRTWRRRCRTRCRGGGCARRTRVGCCGCRAGAAGRGRGATCGFRVRVVRTEQRVQVRSDLRVTRAPLDLRGDQLVEAGNELRHLCAGLAVQLRCGGQLRQLAQAVACGRQRTARGFFINLRARLRLYPEPAAGSLEAVPAAGVDAWLAPV